MEGIENGLGLRFGSAKAIFVSFVLCFHICCRIPALVLDVCERFKPPKEEDEIDYL